MMLERIVGIAFAAALGGCLGSFANVLILRWHEDSSLWGRSKCPNCRRVLRPHHMVPVLSWIFLRGRCADCGKKIHIQYPVVELAAALLGVIAALRWDPVFLENGYHFWFEFLFTIGLLVPLVMDLRWQELPVEYLAGLGILGFLFQMSFVGPASLILAMVVAVIFFGLQVLLSGGKWLGIGDVWFGGMMGAVLGWPSVLLAVYLAYLAGGIFAVVGMALGSVTRRSRIPFAPLLIFGTLVTLWWGPSLLAFVTGSLYG